MRLPTLHPTAMKGAVLALMLAGLGIFWALGLGRYMSLTALQNLRADLGTAYAAHPLQMALAFFLIYCATTGLSLPGAGTILTLAAGAIFGLGWGVLLVSFGSSVGATLAFLTARFVLRDSLQARFGQRLTEINAGIARDGAYYLVTLRLVPLFPFFFVNLVMGLTAMRTRVFYGASQLGMLPGTVLYTMAGTQLAQVSSLRGLLSPTLVGSLVLLGLFPLLARLGVNRWKARRTSNASAQPAATPGTAN